ncbi:MAG: aldo/keto reductase [Acidobacteriaceae bacterium]|nr:aldo/keto reductase [Acidobacteriaceae bacterium]
MNRDIMHYRKLGATESEISEIGYGARGGGNEEQCIRALKRAFEVGVNFVDTAADPEIERLVGRALNEAYARIYVSTRIPPKPGSSAGAFQDSYPLDYLTEFTEQSLVNLRMGQIYLQQFSTWTDEWMNSDEWRRAIEILKSSGKVRFFGICASPRDPDSALEAVRTGAFAAVRVNYGIFDRSAEKNLFPLCQQMKVGVIAQSWQDVASNPEMAPRIKELERDLANVPGTLEQVALRFCLSDKAIASVILDMQTEEAVESNCRAASGGMLDARTLAILQRHAAL